MVYLIIGFLLSIGAGLVAFIDKMVFNKEGQKSNKFNISAFVVLIIGAFMSFWSGYNSQKSSNIAQHKADSVNKVIINKEKAIDSINHLLSTKQDDMVALQKNQIDTSSRILSTSLKTNLLQQQISQLQNKLINKVTGLQSPITDKFTTSFQLWFFNKNYSDILDKALGENTKTKFFSLYPLEISDCNINEVKIAVEDLIKRINKSRINVDFVKSNLQYQPLALEGQVDLHNLDFLTAKSQNNYDETSTSPYRYKYWLTYNRGDKFFRLDIQNLPLRIMFQYHSIISFTDLNDMDINIKTIDIRDFDNFKNITPTFKLEKIELHWVNFTCGTRPLFPFVDPVFNSKSKSYIISKIKIE